METIKKDLGVDSGQMAVFPVERGGDPSLMALVPAQQGAVYHAFVAHSDEGTWGTRVARLVVLRDDCLTERDDGLKEVGQFACRSAKLLVSDPCYYFEDEYGEGGAYDRACSATCDMKTGSMTPLRAGIFRGLDGDGVCCSSGYGDGCYDMTAAVDDRGARRVDVVFIGDEDEEDE